jgi:hypothetical protein
MLLLTMTTTKMTMDGAVAGEVAAGCFCETTIGYRIKENGDLLKVHFHVISGCSCKHVLAYIFQMPCVLHRMFCSVTLTLGFFCAARGTFLYVVFCYVYLIFRMVRAYLDTCVS